MTTMFERIRHLLGAIFASGLIMILTPIAIASAPFLESKLFPVLRNVQLAQVHREGDTAIFEFEGFRGREQCVFVSQSAIAGAAGEPAEMVLLDYVHQGGGSGASRPVGWQSLGEWRVRPVNDNDMVTFIVRHRCHSMWDVTATIGPWPVKEFKK